MLPGQNSCRAGANMPVFQSNGILRNVRYAGLRLGWRFSGGHRIEKEHLPEPVCHQAPAGSVSADLDSFKQIEASFLMNALRQHDWNRMETAKALGIHKTTLFRKIKALGLEVPRE